MTTQPGSIMIASTNPRTTIPPNKPAHWRTNVVWLRPFPSKYDPRIPAPPLYKMCSVRFPNHCSGLE